MEKRSPRKKKSPAEKEAEPRPVGGDSLNAYIREISRFKPLSGDEEKELGRRIQSGDHKALQRLVEEALHLLSHAKVAGIVFNGDDRPSSAYYGYYYGYGRPRGDGRYDRGERPAGRKVAALWR